MFTSVVATTGHTFASTDEPDMDSCLTCGAVYLIVSDDPTDPDCTTGRYVANDGSTPDYCSGDASQLHGYELWCDRCESHECPHIRPCNCMSCA